MAKIKYSALVSDMRNKLNGSVMSKNRYGSYVRNNVTPVNPQSLAQQQQRQIFGSLSQAWRGLTETQRESWISGSKNFPFNDIFGDQKFLSGQTLFIKLNANLEKIGEDRILLAPKPSGGGDVSGVGSIEYDHTTGGFAVRNGDYVVPAGHQIVTYITPPIPAGINFVKNRFRLAGSGVTEEAPGFIWLNLDSGDYISKYGMPAPGSKVFCRVALVNTATGEQGAPMEFMTVVP